MKKILITVLFVFAMFVNNVCDAKCDPSIKVYKLKNGQTVIIKEVHDNPIVTIDTWVKTGSINENDKNNGVAHFLEHLFFKGTKNHKQGEFERILESKGGEFNAATSKDYTHFYVTISSQYFEEALDLHADMLTNIALPEEELAQERKVVIEEINRSKDVPDRILFQNMNNQLFKHHPYKREVIGTEDIIANIPRSEIMDFYQKWYSPANLVTVVVGDVNTAKALQLIEKDFQGKAKEIPAKQVYTPEPFITKPSQILKKGKYNTGYMVMAFKGIPMKNKKESYALDLGASILGDGRTSRLYKNLKDKQKIVTSISAGHSSYRDDSIFYIDANFEPENLDKVKASIITEIKKIEKDGVTKEELTRAKTLAQREFVYGNESVENIAGSLGYSMAIGGNLSYYCDYLDELNQISASDIKKAMVKYVNLQKMTTSILLPDEKTGAKNVADKKPKQASAKQQERAPEPSIPCPNDCKCATKSILANGINLIYDKNTLNDIVSMSVFIKGGQRLDSKAGLSSILAGTILKGTEDKTYEEISKEMENSGIIISPAANPDYFEITVKSTKGDFNKAFNLLSDIIQNATFKEEYIDKSKNDILSGIKQSRDIPSSIAFEEFNTAIYPNHPYGYTGKILEHTIPSITREDVLCYYKKYFSPINMVVSVSGNVDYSDISAKLETICAKDTAEIVDMEQFRTPLYPTEQITNVLVPNDTSTAWMVMGWRAPSIKDNKEFFALKLASGMLGGGMSSRLFVNLREKRGLAYEVGSGYSTKHDNSYFVLYIGTKPENICLVRKLFLDEIYDLMNGKFTKEEFNSAKQKLIGQYPMSQETNAQRAHNLGAFETLGKGYMFNYEYINFINSVTYQDVINTTRKYLCYPYVVSVVAPYKNLEEFKKD